MDKVKTIDAMKNMLQVKEVLKMLGICRNTLYTWEYKKKITPIRDPIFNYRLYNREDVENLMKPIDQKLMEKV